MLANALHEAVAAVAPIVGVSIGREDDKSTWRIRFADDATDGQRAEAHAVLGAFDRLAVVRAEAKRRLDRDAERARMRHITAGTGQALTYQRKSMERMAYLSAVQTSAPITRAMFPMLWASVGLEVPATGDDAADIGAAAALIGERETAFAQIGAAIERARLQAKAAIDAATRDDAINAAAKVDWP